jgi:hypothetical protein
MTVQDPAAAPAAAVPTSVQAPNVDPEKVPDPAPKAAADDAVDPNWLKGRLEREATKAAAKALKDAGFDSAEAAKAAGVALKAKAEADKSADTKAAELKTALDAKTVEATRLTEMAARIATSALSSLTAEQQAAIKAVAGDDPAKQIETIEALKPTWTTATVDPKTGKPAIPPPANTSAAGAAPPPANPGAPNHKATLEALEKANPMAAAHFALRHQGEIYKGDGS